MIAQEFAAKSTPQGGELRFAGRVVLAMTVSAALLCGGLLIAGLVKAGQLDSSNLLRTSTNYFLIGAGLGLLHAIPLGLFGRDSDVELRHAISEQARGLLYALPALTLAWSVAGWIAMNSGNGIMGRGFAKLVLSAVAWSAAIATFVYTARLLWRAFRVSYSRWPERRLATFLVTASFAALTVQLLGHRPELFGARIRVDSAGGLLIAAGIALWIVGPAVTLALRLFRRPPFAKTEFGFGHARRRVGVNLATGLIAGGALSALALPFHLSPYHLPTVVNGHGFAAGVVEALSRAMFDEILLRVVMSAALLALALRWHLRGSTAPIVVAVAGAALLQTLLHVPGIIELGFRDSSVALTYAGGVVLLPALVCGALFWSRGFATALLANASALVLTAALSMAF